MARVFLAVHFLIEAAAKRALCKENARKIPLLVDGTETGCNGASSSRLSLKGSYLVDPASSHMLVSKIKPCMSKYKLLIL